MDKIDTAVARLRSASEMSQWYYGKPLLLTYSGGKDSDACLELAEIAGIPFEVQHNHTTADAPETVRHVRQKFRALELEGVHCEIAYPVYKGRRTSMWDLIPQKLMPPTRLTRYCCEILKEGGGADRWIVTGVRWAESAARKNSRGKFEALGKTAKQKVILNNDNDDLRRLTETCAAKNKRVVNPIIDWSDSDVWDLLRDRQTACNPLYCEFGRVGCVGCPMAGRKGREREFLRWQTYRRSYIAAFDRMLAQRRRLEKETYSWPTGLDVYNWWMEYDVLPGQMDIWEEEQYAHERGDHPRQTGGGGLWR